MHDRHIEGMYEALADLVIVHVQPLGSSQLENLGPRRGGYSHQCLYWENNTTSWRAPDCDRGAQEPKTVQELCTSYLPSNWALMVQGLTIAMSAFDCSEGHQLHCIFILENDPNREAYIRRQLTTTHDAGSSEGVEGGARVVEEGTRVDVEEVHTRITQSRENFDDDEAKEGEEDSGSGEADLGGGAEEDMRDLEDFSDSGSSGDSIDDSIVEGAMVLGGCDRAATSLEGDVADTGTSPIRGGQCLQRTTPVNVVRCSLMHGAPSTRMEKR